MEIRATEEQDWLILKEIRLAAPFDAPTAWHLIHLKCQCK